MYDLYNLGKYNMTLVLSNQESMLHCSHKV